MAYEMEWGIRIYTANYCPYCEKAIVMLFKEGYSFNVIDVTAHEEVRKEIEDMTGCKTVPQIFVDGRFIGGCSDLERLLESGEFTRIYIGEE